MNSPMPEGNDIGLFEDMAALPERVRVPSERGRA